MPSLSSYEVAVEKKGILNSLRLLERYNDALVM
jgi:hypothetical protein